MHCQYCIIRNNHGAYSIIKFFIFRFERYIHTTHLRKILVFELLFYLSSSDIDIIFMKKTDTNRDPYCIKIGVQLWWR